MSLGVLTLQPGAYGGTEIVDIAGDFQLDGNTLTSGGGSFTLTADATAELIRKNAQIARGDHIRIGE